MKINFSKFFIYSILIGLSVVMTGCLAMKGRFSKGHPYIERAEKLWKNNQQLEALIEASEGVIIDPEFIQGKEYFRDYFDQGVANAQAKLSQLGNPTRSEDAEEQFKIYDNLTKLYGNLSKVKLPMKHPKGKWEWTTKITDYSKQQADSRRLAFNLLMQEARAMVTQKDIEGAEKKFTNATRNYLASKTEKDSVSNQIANELCSFAEKFSQSTAIEEAILSHTSYASALRFVSSNEVAMSGVTNTKAHISNLYVKEGEVLIAKSDVESWISSIDSFKKAITWNKSNEVAQGNLTKTTERIAEHYYQLALKAEGANTPDQAIALHQEVRKWIPDYKDSMQRIYTIRLSGKMAEMAKNLSTTRAEFGKLQGRMGTVSKAVDQSVEVMGKVTYISDNTRSLNETMKTTSHTLKIFNVIPTVGTATGMLARSIDLVQEPVGKVATKFTAIEKPVITPTKEIVEKTQVVVNKAKTTMEKTEGILKTTENYTLRYKDCLAQVAQEQKFQEAEKAVDEINNGLLNTNKTLIEINGGFQKVENETKKIGQVAGTVNQVAKGLKDVTDVVNKIKPIVDELNGVLDKEFSLKIPWPVDKKFSFSVRKILTGLPDEVKVIMGKFSELAMGVVKPVLKKFDINVPSIPGIDKLSQALDSFKGYYDNINSEYGKMSKAVNDFTSYQQHVDTNLKKLEAAIGCQPNAL